MKIFFFIFLIFYTLNISDIAISRAWAENDEYTIRHISVDIVDQSSVKARDIAFAKAQEKAFLALAKKYGQETGAQIPSAQTLSTMIQNFEIESEQTSRTRYRGVFTFRFRPTSVAQYFGSSLRSGSNDPERPRLEYSGESFGNINIREHKILLIPFTKNGENWVLWDTKNNVLFEKLKKNLSADPSSAPFLLPEGTILDSTDIWEKVPDQISGVSIKRIQARYGVDEVMIAAVYPIQKSEKISSNDSLKVDIYRAPTGRLLKMTTIPIRVSVLDSDYAGYQKAAEQIISLAKQDWNNTSSDTAGVEEENVVASTDNSIEDANAVEQQEHVFNDNDASLATKPSQSSSNLSYSHVPKTIPSTVSTNYSSAATARFTINYKSFSEWTQMQQFLKSSQSVTNYSLRSLKTDQATVDIGYRNWQQLMRECSSRGYKIRAFPNGGYEIYQ